MDTGLKIRIKSVVTALVVLIGSVSPAVPVMADEPSEGQMKAYERQKAAMEYAIEVGAEEAEARQEREEEEWKRDHWVYGWWYPDWYHPYWHHPERHYTRYNNVTLDIGDTYRLGYAGVIFWSDNSNVASVDGNGNITANNDGNCRIYARGYDGSIYAVTEINVRRANKDENKNNVVYYPVNTAPTVTANANASWLAIATNLVATAPKGGTVNLSTPAPISFDSSFANVLKLRPDVTVNVTFGYNGHSFLLTIPAGYNLAGTLNAFGYVDLLTLSNLKDGRVICRLIY